MNLIELGGFFYVGTPEEGVIGLTLYYIFTEITFFSLLALSLENAHILSRKVKIALIICLAIAMLPLLIPGAALAGAQSIGYTITRVAGPLYLVVQIGILAPLILSVLISIYYSRNHVVHSARRKSQILLFACSPIYAAIFTIILLMQLGVQLNAVVIASLMTTITLLILLDTEHREHQYRFMSMIPRTWESQFVKELTRTIADSEGGIAKGRRMMEQEMIREALIVARGNRVKAAKMLGISRQTLQRLQRAERE